MSRADVEKETENGPRCHTRIPGLRECPSRLASSSRSTVVLHSARSAQLCRGHCAALFSHMQQAMHDDDRWPVLLVSTQLQIAISTLIMWICVALSRHPARKPSHALATSRFCLEVLPPALSAVKSSPQHTQSPSSTRLQWRLRWPWQWHRGMAMATAMTISRVK
jgi:hypothetical protein